MFGAINISNGNGHLIIQITPIRAIGTRERVGMARNKRKRSKVRAWYERSVDGFEDEMRPVKNAKFNTVYVRAADMAYDVKRRALTRGNDNEKNQ